MKTFLSLFKTMVDFLLDSYNDLSKFSKVVVNVVLLLFAGMILALILQSL